MCLGVPGKIVERYLKDGLNMGLVDFGGVQREACLEALPEAQVGDYTIVHAGFALNLLSPEEAGETLSALRELAEHDPLLRQDLGIGLGIDPEV